MKPEEVIKLKIGDMLYGYSPIKNDISTYVVCGIRDYGNAVLYEVECTNSDPKEYCRILVSQVDDAKKFQYVAMVDIDLDDEYGHKYIWHEDEKYYLTIIDAKIAAYNHMLRHKKEKLELLKKQAKELEEGIDKLNMLIKDCHEPAKSGSL
jgi:hypothetical protein